MIAVSLHCWINKSLQFVMLFEIKHYNKCPPTSAITGRLEEGGDEDDGCQTLSSTNFMTAYSLALERILFLLDPGSLLSYLLAVSKHYDLVDILVERMKQTHPWVIEARVSSSIDAACSKEIIRIEALRRRINHELAPSFVTMCMCDDCIGWVAPQEEEERDDETPEIFPCKPQPHRRISFH